VAHYTISLPNKKWQYTINFQNKKWLSILTNWFTDRCLNKALNPSLHVSNVTDVLNTANLFGLGGRCISALQRFEIKQSLSQDLRHFTSEETFSCHLILHCSQLPRYGLQGERPHLQNVGHRNIKGWILLQRLSVWNTDNLPPLMYKTVQKMPPRDSISHRPAAVPMFINCIANKKLEFWLITDITFFKKLSNTVVSPYPRAIRSKAYRCYVKPRIIQNAIYNVILRHYQH
jgi:hypothetical protein